MLQWKHSRIGIAMIALLVPLSDVLADPPPDWHLSQTSGLTVYRPEGNAFVELRLHAPETTQPALAQSIDDWFAGRTSAPLQGIELAKYGEPNRTRSDLRLAAGLGSNAKGKIVVVAIGCERSDHGKSYAELLAPLDTNVVERYSQMAGDLVAESCHESAPMLAATANPQVSEAPTVATRPSAGN